MTVLKPLFAMLLILPAWAPIAAADDSPPATVVPEDRLNSGRWAARHTEKVALAKNGNVDLLLVGDSITKAWENQHPHAESFSAFKTLNLGFGGDRTQNVLWRLRNGEIDGVSPKLVTLMIGTNNSKQDTPGDIFLGIRAIVAELRSQLPDAKIAVFSIFPRKPGLQNDTVGAVNAMLPKLADGEKVLHVNINDRFLDADGNQLANLYHRDLLHLSAGGYAAWFDAIKSLVNGEVPASAPARAAAAEVEHPVIRLWPVERIGGEANKLKEDVEVKNGITRYLNIKDPNLTVFAADSARPSPAAIFCPGGAYRLLAEMPDLIRWLNAQGITVFMLKYTVPDDREAAFRDVQRAMRIVRHRAAEWNVDPERLGLIGNSAGGHLSARLSHNYKKPAYEPIDDADTESCEPAFVILVSPAYLDGKGGAYGLAPELHLQNKVAPTFLVIAKDDKAYIEGSIRYEKGLKDKELSIRMQLYDQGGHGLRGVDWHPVCREWLAGLGLVQP